MKRFSWLPTVALATISLAVTQPFLMADEHNHKTVISISQPLEVPGVVLAPGKYVMRLFDSSSNRHIVQFMNESQTRQLALTFAIAAERVNTPTKTILTMYEGSNGAPPALRTWYYPGDTNGEEFLYPHKQAVRISERTNEPVPDVETGQAASAKEAAASVSPAAEPEKSPGEEAFIAKAEPAPAPFPEPVAAPEPAPAPEPQQAAAEPQAPPADNTQSAAAATTDDKSLPKTAGYGPLAALVGGLSFMLAFGLRKLKRSRVL